MRTQRLILLTLLLLTLSVTAFTAKLTVSFIDVGQADSILVQFPAGQTMLVDAGNQADGKTIVKYLKSRSVKRIDYLVATHPHEDHIGGMLTVMAAFPIGRVWDSGYNHGSNLQKAFLQRIKAKKLQYGQPRAGYTRDIGKVHVDVLAPGEKLVSGTESDANNNSLVIRLSYEKVSYLLAGDMEDAERATVAKWPQSTVLKVAHHGSRNGTDATFLKAVAPTYAVISYGIGNSYGHPHTEALSALADARTKIYSTASGNTIILQTDGKTVSYVPVATKKNSTTSAVIQSTTHHAASSVGTDTVYITNTGKCYHSGGCNSLRRSCIAISRADAIAQGYRACSRCRP